MREGEEISIGKQKNTTSQKRKESANFVLLLENRIKTMPTTPYNFNKKPIAMNKTAQKSLPTLT